MGTNTVFNGTTYVVPSVGDSRWGANVSAYLIAIAAGALQKTGGNFTLTADVNFGATYGLVSAYFKSRTSNIATAGAVRLANTDLVDWRNAANDGNLPLGVNASDELEFNGDTIIAGLAVSDTATIDMDLTAGVLSANIVVASIDNSFIAAGAAIAVNKLAALTVSRAVVSDGSGFLAASATTSTELGYVNGVTSAIQTQLDARVLESLYAAKGTILAASGVATPIGLAVGTDGLVLTADSGEASGLGWTAVITNPMDAEGDMIVGDTGGAPIKLAIGAADTVLVSDATNQSWAKIVNANVDAAAAIAYSKLDLVGDIVNADINASAAIAVSKLAALTVSRAVVSDGSGFLAASATTSTEIGYVNGVTSAIQTQLDARVLESLYTAKGDILGASAAATPATLTVGTDGQVLTANSANPTGLGWSSPLTNPMDSEGDLIVGGVGGAATKLDSGTSNYLLKANGAAAPSWALLVDANVDAAAAIAYSKLNLATSIVNADINASAAIAYSKLNLATSIVNADINASAAIAVSKLAALTASRAVVSDGSGFLAASAVTSTQIGYLSGASGTTGTGSLVYATGPTLTPTTASFTVPAVTKYTSGTGTYTVQTSPRLPLFLIVTVVGGGGGGAGSGTASSSSNGSAGSESNFYVTGQASSSLLRGLGGGAPAWSAGGAGGGTAALGTAIGTALTGGAGQGTSFVNITTINVPGGAGGVNPMGGSSGSSQGASGGAGIANTGAGGAGGGTGGSLASYSGAGGGAGGFVRALILNPSGTFDYTVGGGGNGGSAGTNGFAGGNGAVGYVEVIPIFQ